MISITKPKKRVVVAMSGGVDSSVAAALLLEQGYDVIGVTMQIWQNESQVDETGVGCCSLKAVNDARLVADKLGIPFYVYNFQDLFNQRVIEYFTEEYQKGRTPNPCIACNKYIKFEAFYEKAKTLDADFIATGHYGTIKYDNEVTRYLLYRGIDNTKDQSYALYTMTQEQLSHTIFPLGEYTKNEIRKKAAEIGLKVADKPDSQEICFIPDNDYKRFLFERISNNKIKPGSFVNTKGEVIGTHKGIINYTVGQRKGLGLALGYPAYVVGIDKKKNRVIIGRDEDVYQKGLIAKDNNYIAVEKIDDPIEVQAKIRYSAKPASALITTENDGRVKVVFENDQRAITPGQAVVYYQEDMVVGGGTIDEVIYTYDI